MPYTYILQCSDGTLYTGSTTDLDRRVHEHNHSKVGAKYTKTRRPVELIYSEEFETLREAMVREAQIKKLSRGEKDKLLISKKDG